LLALTAVALSGCELRGGKIPYDPAGFGPPDPTAAPNPGYAVALGPLDTVKVTVFRIPDLSGDYQVDGRGVVDLPLIGEVPVDGRNAEQFAQELERQYGARYLNNPEITVRLLTTNQYNITVEGGVNAPGVFPLPGRTTLLGAIAMSRGFLAYDSNPKRVAIFRKQGGKTVAAAFDVVAIRHGDMQDPLVYPGDTIVVDSSKVRSIYRDLLQTIPVIAIFNSL
jgi:polysaccharide export outer membrane protein